MEYDGRMPGYRHCSRFRGMVKLTVAALLANLRPSLPLDHSDRVPYCHCTQCMSPSARKRYVCRLSLWAGEKWGQTGQTALSA
jgi:hypothetical protein